jgi:hypothetical protein
MTTERQFLGGNAMDVTYVAAVDTAALAGRLMAVALICIAAIAGLVMLIVGLRRHSASRRQPPGYPPGPAAYSPPPPGYPAQPGQPAEPGAWGYQSGPPQPIRPKSSGTALIVIGAVLLVFGCLGIVGQIVATVTKGPHFKAGDCFTNATVMTGSGDPKPSDCSDPDAVLEYATKTSEDGNCPDGERDNSMYLSKVYDRERYCFASNLIQGECYVPASQQLLDHKDCDAAKAAKVVKRIDGRNDFSECSAGTRSLTYPDPARTYCLRAAASS